MISDAQIIELFRKYEKQTMDSFKETINDSVNNYQVGDLKEYEIWDEMFCRMCEKEFTEAVLENIEDSIGVEEYGIINLDEEDD